MSNHDTPDTERSQGAPIPDYGITDLVDIETCSLCVDCGDSIPDGRARCLHCAQEHADELAMALHLRAGGDS